MTERRVADIDLVAITLEIAKRQALFLLLARDGTVNRMGSGRLPSADQDMYIGRSEPPLLPAVLAALSDPMLRHTGGYDIPEKSGAPCRLAIMLRFADGSEDGFGFTYGSESEGPPADIAQFVRTAVEASQEWYERQRHMTGKAPAPTPSPTEQQRRAWWRFW